MSTRHDKLRTPQGSEGPARCHRTSSGAAEHRADRAASKFLKKRFAVAKADGRTGLAFGRARARSAANLVEIELKY